MKESRRGGRVRKAGGKQKKEIIFVMQKNCEEKRKEKKRKWKEAFISYYKNGKGKETVKYL